MLCKQDNPSVFFTRFMGDYTHSLAPQEFAKLQVWMLNAHVAAARIMQLRLGGQLLGSCRRAAAVSTTPHRSINLVLTY